MGQIPGNLRWMIGIAVIRRRLLCDAEGVHYRKSGVDDGREDGWERGSNVHHSLDQHDKHRENSNNDIEGSDTKPLVVSLSYCCRNSVNLQLIPRGRSGYRSVVRIRIENLDGIAVPTMVCSFLPKASPIQVWIRNTEQSKG